MAVDMFLKLDGIDGESQDKDHKAWIDVLAFSWGASVPTTPGNSGAAAGRVAVESLSITHFVDASSPILLSHICSGAHIKTANLVCRKAGETPVEFLKIDLSNVLITSLASGGSGGEDRLTENLTLNFAQIVETYTPQNAAGAALPPVMGSCSRQSQD